MAAKKSAAASGKPSKPSKTKSKKTDRDAQTLGKIEKLARNVLGEVTKGSNPALEIRTRTLSNVSVPSWPCTTTLIRPSSITTTKSLSSPSWNSAAPRG